MNEFLTKVHSLEESEKISQEMAIMLRSQYATINDLSEISHNKEGTVTDEVVYEMARRVKNRAEKDVKIQLRKEFDDLQKGKEKFEEDRNAVEKRRSDLISEQRKTFKLKQDTEIIIDNLEKKRDVLSKEKEDYENKVKYVKTKQKAIIQKAKNKANIIKKIFKILIYFLLLVLSLGITFLFALGTWKVSDLTKTDLVWSYIYVGFISIVSLILTIISIVKMLSFYVSKMAEKIYDYCYSREIEKYKELFE